MTVAGAYTAALQRGRFVVLVLWIVLGGAMAAFIMKFISATSQQFDPPSGTQSFDADAILGRYFPDQVHQTTFIVFVHCNVAANITALPTLKLFFDGVTSIVNSSLRPQYPTSQAIPLNYYDLRALTLTDLAAQMIAPNGHAMLLPVTTQFEFTSSDAQDFGIALENQATDLAARTLLNETLLQGSGIVPSDIDFGFNGLPLFVHDVVATVKTDMALMDAIVLPIAFLVLAVTVRSLRLLVLPIVTMGLALSVSFGMMYFVASNVVVSSTAPSLMMSLCIAMSIDYNLFLIARYTEELRRGARGTEVVATVLSAAGHTILVSGTTLMISCLGMLFFPLNILRSFGMGCALAIALAMIVSLSFSPALLLAFPTFFEACVEPFRWRGFCCRDGDARNAAERQPVLNQRSQPTLPTQSQADPSTFKQGPASAAASVPPSVADADLDVVAPHLSNSDATGAFAMEDSVFYRLRVILRFPWNILVTTVLLALVGALVVPILDFKISDAFEVYIARGSTFRSQWEMFLADFGYGYTSPYRFVFTVDVDSPDYDGTSLFNNSALLWSASSQILTEIIADPTYDAQASQFTGPLMVGGRAITFTTFVTCLMPLACPDANLAFVMATDVSQNRQAIVVDFTSSFSPTGNNGDAIYKSMLRVISAARVDEISKAYGAPPMRVYVTGLGPNAMDSIDRIYELFPIIVGITMAVVFVVVLAAFRTPIVPLRAVLSIASTEVVAFGLVKLVYQSPGVLDWLGWPAVQPTGAVTWIVPIVAFTVIAGIALDYDVFLLTRVEESLFVDENKPTVAVLKALCATGRIITAAGIIMAIAFFGLLLSSTQALNVLGFYLVVAVLFDTFIVRTLMVPAVMSLLGRFNWWPRNVDFSQGASTRALHQSSPLDAATVDAALMDSSAYPYLGPGGEVRARSTAYRSRKIERAPSVASQEDRASVVIEAGTPNHTGPHIDFGAV